SGAPWPPASCFVAPAPVRGRGLSRALVSAGRPRRLRPRASKAPATSGQTTPRARAITRARRKHTRVAYATQPPASRSMSHTRRAPRRCHMLLVGRIDKELDVVLPQPRFVPRRVALEAKGDPSASWVVADPDVSDTVVAGLYPIAFLHHLAARDQDLKTVGGSFALKGGAGAVESQSMDH